MQVEALMGSKSNALAGVAALGRSAFDLGIER